MSSIDCILSNPLRKQLQQNPHKVRSHLWYTTHQELGCTRVFKIPFQRRQDTAGNKSEDSQTSHIDDLSSLQVRLKLDTRTGGRQLVPISLTTSVGNWSVEYSLRRASTRLENSASLPPSRSLHLLWQDGTCHRNLLTHVTVDGEFFLSTMKFPREDQDFAGTRANVL